MPSYVNKLYLLSKKFKKRTRIFIPAISIPNKLYKNNLNNNYQVIIICEHNNM